MLGCYTYAWPWVFSVSRPLGPCYVKTVWEAVLYLARLTNFWGMQANCLQYIEFFAAKMDSETCRNLGIANNFMVTAQIVGKL